MCKDLSLRWARKAHTNTTEEQFHQSVLDGRAEEYGREVERDSCLPDRRCRLYVGRERIANLKEE